MPLLILASCAEEPPEADTLGVVAQTTTTLRPQTTTTQPPTTAIDLSPQITLRCPPPDQGPWDWYEAVFDPDIRMADDFQSAVINYGDGKSYESSTWDDASRNMFWHRYGSPGSYFVSVTILDTAGRVGTGSCTFEWAATAPTISNSCDPNYEGACVPIASDVDCASGSGNGPAYVSGPVYVVGRDIYGLDGDNDGIGCE